MPLSERENYLRTITFANPEWIPMSVHVSDASRDQFRDEMEEVMARHPLLFPGFKKGGRDFDNYEFAAAHRAAETFTDSWGCVWESAVDGLEGQVLECPLSDWEALERYKIPDPLVQADRAPADWEGTRKGIEQARANGDLTSGGVPHGFMLMRLWYLRGFQNLMLDIATEDPRLQTLIDMVVEHNRIIVDQYLGMGVDMMSFGEDLGTQTASIISPAAFHKWIAPAYRKLMQPCRRAGTYVYLHSDGYIMELMDELLACGVDIINPQDLCNGIDNLVEHVKGRMCISLDIDRQKIVPFGTRQEIHDLIEEEVRKLGSPQGGLQMVAGIYPPTPPENVDALCEALEKFRTYWW